LEYDALGCDLDETLSRGVVGSSSLSFAKDFLAVTTSSLLPAFQTQLQWPSPETVFSPPGAGPSVYARLARQKIEQPLRQTMQSEGVRVGVLVGAPNNDSSDAPIAIVCESANAITDDVLSETRRLAWNFCRSPLLITIEPHLIRAWSCFERPDAHGEFPASPLEKAAIDASLNLQPLAETLHWIHLASGSFLNRHADRFRRNERADTTLLENLRFIREKLTESLDEDIAHDLLARIIFIQFLFHRKDSRGHSALNAAKLRDLYGQGILSRAHEDLPSILGHKGDTFRLFRWLNGRFNGDLFPSSYTEEERQVKKGHLGQLAGFVSGKMQMEKDQYLLWPHYSFDTIPLEFISSIYEEFVTKRKDEKKGIGDYYTRPYLVDFILDKVLPWSGEQYRLRILDPCCGSGVFLVKAFQRLVYRWRTANEGKEPTAAVLRDLLENCLFGVDIEKNAIHVASFSLYLAMCDEIDPRHYWTQVQFPKLRDETLRDKDFFAEDQEGIRTTEDAESYDLVIGNAPWGEKSLTDKAKEWAVDDEHGWPTVDDQGGLLFLAKSALLCKESGRICMIQPAGSLLFNVSTTALAFRKALFESYKVEQVINLSDLRFLNLFPETVGPACIIVMQPISPDGQPLAYWSPKQTRSEEEQCRVMMDDQDLNWVWPEEAAADPIVWPALMWGGRRDLDAVRRLRLRSETLNSALKSGKWSSERGFDRGILEVREHPELLGLRILEENNLWRKCSTVSRAKDFPENHNPRFSRCRRREIYNLPLVLVKKSWTASSRRFRAVLVEPDGEESLLYSQSYMGVRTADRNSLVNFTIVANSSLAVYYLYLTSGRLASYRPSLRNEDLRELPLPPDSADYVTQLSEMSDEEIDEAALDLYELNLVERALAEEFFHITLRDFKEPCNTPGRQPVWRSSEANSERLETYCEWFTDVLRSGFGPDKAVCATILDSGNTGNFPFCVVGVHFDWAGRERTRYQGVTSTQLLDTLREFDAHEKSRNERWEGVCYRRVSRVYQSFPVEQDGTFHKVPTVFIIKPNQVRYWTRSIAMRDADEVSADIVQWSQMNATQLSEDHSE
jgi:hypothetical protein